VNKEVVRVQREVEASRTVFVVFPLLYLNVVSNNFTFTVITDKGICVH